MATPAPNFTAIAIGTAITPRRIAGLCAMALGVYLARKPQ